MENVWLNSCGRLQADGKNLRLLIDFDFIKYYKSFVDKEFKIFSNGPRHYGHVSIIIDKIHGVWDDKLIRKILKENKQPIKFSYNPFIRVGGYTKGFLNFYLMVRSPALDEIAGMFGITNDWHITICNTKGGVPPYIWMK